MYDFYNRLARIVNSGQSNSIIISGNIYDLFWNGEQYVPLVPFLLAKTAPAGRIHLVYELNGPIRVTEEHRNILLGAWVEWKSRLVGSTKGEIKGLSEVGSAFLQAVWSGKKDAGDEFKECMNTAIGNTTFALEFLRQLCFCSREVLGRELMIFIEAADMMVPAGNGDVASLNDMQLRRVSILQDWFSDPAFLNGRDVVCLLAESRSMIHPRISRLPQVSSIEVASPSTEDRKHFIGEYCNSPNQRCSVCRQLRKDHSKECLGLLQWDDAEQFRAAQMTAGLSIHALRQLLAEAAYEQKPLSNEVICEAVEAFIQSQVGEDVVEFSRPHHKLDAVIGATKLVSFLKKELIPRIQEGSLSGCAVAGPIGGGKTYIFEAVAAELNMPVLVLKNLRSQWFGQTDVIFERLKRALEALDRVCIFMDEADTQFGGVGKDAHETERRLTGKVQQMMSDPRLKGKLIWLLMTARIHALSPDIRRPGRAGDLILPVIDPEGKDRKEFIRWALEPVFEKSQGFLSEQQDVLVDRLNDVLDRPYSAAAFAMLRTHLKSNYIANGRPIDQVLSLVQDLIPPAIGKTREYQTLQALFNCTRRSLLPDIADLLSIRLEWEKRIRELEFQGVM